MDYSNGLLLCYYGAFMSYFAGISHVIVCNPATQEWMALPHTQPGSDDSYYDLVLCFDPLWSQHFCVFKFRNRRSWEYGEHSICEIEIFFSEDSTWYSSLWEHEIGFYGSTHFIRGVLYVEHLWGHCVLAVDAPDTSTQWLNQKTIKLPGFPVDPGMFDCFRGRLAESLGVLCYAQQEIDGCMMRIWSLEGSSPDRWVVTHRLSMMDAFGRDILFRTNHEGKWCFDYDILAFDLERELVILVDHIAGKILSFSISTGKLSEIRNYTQLGSYYVPYYSKFPASVLQGAQDEC